jgi:N-acetylmuramoyl-L-alanine amidase
VEYRALAVIGAVALAVLAGARALDGARRGAHAAAPAPWPDGPLTPRPPVFPPGFGVRRVLLDPGHGAENNRGNLSCFCVDEQDFTLAAAVRIRARLEATGHFEVRLGREDGAAEAYAERVDDAEAFGADAFVSLHSDVRGHSVTWSPEPGRNCPLAFEGEGFSVLYADEGDPALVEGRLRLARALAGALRARGFAPYALRYDAYAADEAPGVFVDRHAPAQRIFVLRRPSMPSVILETPRAGPRSRPSTRPPTRSP